MSEFSRLLEENLDGLYALTPGEMAILELHFELLQRWNRRMNLTSLRSTVEIVLRHYCESLLFGSRLPGGRYRLADIGSGPGFPGFPIAVVRPDCHVSLVESNSRKCVFLRESSRNLPTVRVLEQRAEHLTESFDWIVTRAVNWAGLWPLIPRIASRVGLLLGASDAERMMGVAGYLWERPEPLPWGDRRVMLFGTVSRGTS
jgi:16S rRNA G527 N7-methylase RsmG